jgi:hypothetical protein
MAATAAQDPLKAEIGAKPSYVRFGATQAMNEHWRKIPSSRVWPIFTVQHRPSSKQHTDYSKALPDLQSGSGPLSQPAH